MTWEEMVNSTENRERQKKLTSMVDSWGEVVAGLEIRQIKQIEEIDIVPDRNGGMNPVFYQGRFSFNTTCGVGIAYYPETQEFASEPFFIDYTDDFVLEPPRDWVQVFIDKVAAAAESGIPAEGLYMFYENLVHPPIPEKC